MAQKRTMKCSACTYEGVLTKSTMFCEECNEHLCNTCTKHHQKFSMLRRHRVVKIEEFAGLTSEVKNLTIGRTAALQSKGTPVKLPPAHYGVPKPNLTDSRDDYEKPDITYPERQSAEDTCSQTGSDSVWEDNEGYVKMGSGSNPLNPPPKCHKDPKNKHSLSYINFMPTLEAVQGNQQKGSTQKINKINISTRSGSADHEKTKLKSNPKQEDRKAVDQVGKDLTSDVEHEKTKLQSNPKQEDRKAVDQVGKDLSSDVYPTQVREKTFNVTVAKEPLAKLCDIQGAQLMKVQLEEVTFWNPITTKVVYTFKTSWIRRWGYMKPHTFYLEVGRKCPNGEGKISCTVKNVEEVMNILEAMNLKVKNHTVAT